jgi:hypothetical protein
MATEGEVVVTDAVPSTRRLDTRTMTNGASHTVDREVHVIGDDTTPGSTARVKAASTAAVAADPALVVSISPNSGTVTDGTNVATVKAASTAAVAADKALVVALSPSTPTVTDGTNAAAVKAASTAAVAADKALVVTISPNTPVNVFTGASTTANAPAQQTVGTTSGSVLASNTARKKCFVVNTGSTIIYLGLGQTPTATAYHVALSPCANAPNDGSGGTFNDDTWDGAISAISSAAGGTVCVTELT